MPRLSRAAATAVHLKLMTGSILDILIYVFDRYMLAEAPEVPQREHLARDLERAGFTPAKVQRALVSEIVGYNVEAGKRTSSRIDPLQIENNVDIYEMAGGGWTFDIAEALRDDNQNPKKLKPSEINHGNITPSMRHEDKNARKQVLNHGGVTLEYAVQHTVLSLAALRRLRFPVNDTLKTDIENAARSVLAALGLAAICFLDGDGYDLRSRCLLDGPTGTFQLVGGGVTADFKLDADSAAALLKDAVAGAKAKGLPWPEKPITLKPSESLSKLVVASRRKSMVAGAGA